jgi:excinuclease ABC subunit C
LDLSELNIKQKRYKVCLEYHIGNCKGPCVENQSSEDYQTSIRFVESILKGQIHTVIQYVKTKMMEFASQQKFEEAQIMKNKVDLLENYKSKSTIVSPKIQAVDVISAIEDNKSFFVNYLVISNGSIIHGITIEIQKKLTETIEEILSFAILELRNRFNSQSKEVLVDIDMLNEIPGFKWVQPLIGDKKQLVELSQRNE